MNSVDAVEWFAYSDWCQDHNRMKTSAFAGKVGRALLAIPNPRMILHHCRRPCKTLNRNWRPTYTYWSPQQFVEGKERGKSVAFAEMEKRWGWSWIPLNECCWVWARNSDQGGHPGHLPLLDRYERVARKFFYCLIQRAGNTNATDCGLRRTGV